MEENMKRSVVKSMKIISLIAFIVFVQSSLSFAGVSTLAVYSDPVPNQSKIKVSVGNYVLPDNPPEGYYRVKMVRSEICNSDRRVLAGTKTSDLSKRRIVLGHEGIGRISQLPPDALKLSGDLKTGDMVVLLPHYVEKDDPMLTKGLPNLSRKMKHLGIHINGVFADYMDFPEYNVYKITSAEATLKKTKDPEAYYDQMVMIEPLACVQRGYRLLADQDYFKKGQIKTALILGAGPMGVIHALHLQKRYPEMKVDIYDIDPIRRNLAKNVDLLKARVLEKHDESRQYDLVIAATSSRDANLKDAIDRVRNNGVILLFSGIDMKEGDPRPTVGGVDIETVHRYEGSVRLMNYESSSGERKSIYFIGTSGYIKDDIARAIKELDEDFLSGDKSIYRDVSTTMIKKLDGKTAYDLSKHFHDVTFNEPAIIPLLKLYDPNVKGDADVHNYLKIFVRHE
jgi:threonine dehydrogenase-like Zn-dependent dehydrogenase